MSSPAISDKEFAALFKASGLSSILEQLDAEAQAVDAAPRSTIAARKEAMAQALATLDDEKLIEYQELLSNYVDALSRNEVEFTGSGAELEPQQLTYLMRRHLDTKGIKELVEVVEAGLKRIIGEAITAKVARENPDEEFPEHVSDSLDVPELGKRFCKEGAGRNSPYLDQEELRKQLGEEVWARVVTTTHVPAHTVTELSEELLMAEALKDPMILQKLKAAFIPGGWKSWRFTVRNITGKTKK